MEHPKNGDGKLLHTYCVGTSLNDREHTRHPTGIPVRAPGQCLYCDEIADDLDPDTRETKTAK